MGILDKFKKWLDENEGEFKDSSDKATKFLEELGREIGYAGKKVAKSTEEALKRFDEEISKDKSPAQPDEDPYSTEPDATEAEDYFEESDEESTPEENEIDEAGKEVSHVEKLMGRIDELIAELKEEDEEEVPDPRDHKTAIDQDWNGMDDDFIKKATRFADRELSKGDAGKNSTREGKVKGFDDRDDDGDEIIDDAEIEED
jgi:hypothetical protein